MLKIFGQNISFLLGRGEGILHRRASYWQLLDIDLSLSFEVLCIEMTSCCIPNSDYLGIRFILSLHVHDTLCIVCLPPLDYSFLKI